MPVHWSVEVRCVVADQPALAALRLRREKDIVHAGLVLAQVLSAGKAVLCIRAQGENKKDQ